MDVSPSPNSLSLERSAGHGSNARPTPKELPPPRAPLPGHFLTNRPPWRIPPARLTTLPDGLPISGDSRERAARGARADDGIPVPGRHYLNEQHKHDFGAL